MIYIGEYMNGKVLMGFSKGLLATTAVCGLGLLTLTGATFMERSNTAGMQAEITSKSQAVTEAKEAEKNAPVKKTEAQPKGLQAVTAFETKMRAIAKEKGCAVTQFQAADQMNPFVSAFSAGAQTNSSWLQVEVKINLQGTTKSVVETMRELRSISIPYEFSSVEISRSSVSPGGEATLSANVSVRVVTTVGAV